MKTETVPAELLATRAAIWIADRAWSAIAVRGEAHIAVSGGSTPAAMLTSLATLSLPWHHVHVWQVDERVAPDGDAVRNANQLAPLEAVGAVLHRMPVTATNLAEAAAAYGRALPQRLDVVHLGIGDDGHTASWPPGDAVLHSTASCTVVGPFNGMMRMTLTPRIVNAARVRMFLAGGEAKRPMLDRLIARDGTIPASHVQPADTTVLTDLRFAALTVASSD
jgi:6-phosphogluconolactonase/glucosamine-6-phosphate isomerase/deaminase